MADTTYRKSIQAVVKDFVLKFKGNEDDYLLFLQHAIDCYRGLNINHLPYYTETKLTVSAIGVVTMPTDMIDFISIGIPSDGMFWSFTLRRDMVTTYDSNAGTFDTSYGEGFGVPEPAGVDYGVVGGKNDYYYFVDWSNRRILVDGLTSATVTLRYISSGITSGAETYVPLQAIRPIDTYLRWMQSQMDALGLGDQQLRKQDYDEAIRELQRQQLPTLDEFRDALYSTMTQAPQR